jgi:hypothetical protein
VERPLSLRTQKESGRNDRRQVLLCEHQRIVYNPAYRLLTASMKAAMFAESTPGGMPPPQDRITLLLS